jgi:hypothetical protein
MTVDDKVIALMRGCGHYLHHSMGAENSKELLLMLSEDEKRVLCSLLKKCLKAWNN